MHSPAVPSRRRRAAPLVAAVALIAGAAVGVALLWSGSDLRAPEAAGPTETTATTAPAAPAVVPLPASAPVDAVPDVDPPADAGIRSSALASADVEVRVVDEADRPVVGATVRLSATFAKEPTDPALSAVTDLGGRAVLHAVQQGRWFASAGHAELFYSPEQQDAAGRRPIDVPGRLSTTLRLGEPYVVGVRVRGGEVLHQQFAQDGAAFIVPWWSPSSAALDQLGRRLQARWPGAMFQLLLRAPRERQRPGDRCGAVVVVRGRATWTSNLSPVPLREFQGPIELDAAQLTRSDAFGTVALRALGSGGDVTRELAVNASTSAGALRLDQRIENGDEITLPCGDYSLRCDEPFLQQLLPAGVTVVRGSRCAIDFDGRLLTRCEIELDGPAETRSVRIAHSSLKQGVDRTVRGRGTLSCWLPEGTITATFRGEASGAGVGPGNPRFEVIEKQGPLLGRSAAVAVGCGTMAAPQRVVLTPVARR
jgi:hypothetical protein